MGRKAKGKHRLDKYYYLAKEQGFRSRAAFKLVQLNRKYDFLSKARACMDLCAAPGGWLQVAQKYMPMSSTIVGVDLAPIRPIRGVTTLVEDITTQSCRAALKRVTPKGLKYDVVIHDGAPNVGGNFAKESYTQAALTLDSLRLATEFLGPGGWFVTKVFRSVEYHALLYACQQLFKKVESTKPVASRGTSAEIYVVCSGYLAPTKIDPRLLDAKHLFADTEAEIQPIDVTKDNGKRKRNRSGYEDGVSTLYKECAAEEFIVNDKPGEMLGSHHTFILDGRNRKGLVPPKEGWMDLDNHPTTTDEIRSLVSDLGVLGKADFKLLLRWRMTIRKQTGLEKKKHRRGEDASSDEESSDDDDDDEDDEDDDEKEGADEKDQLLNEMSELKNSIDAQARRDKKKKAKLRAKERLRVARGLAASGEAIVEQEMDLFSLARIKTAKALDVVSKAPAPGSAAAYDSDEDPDEDADSDGSDSDTEEDERRLDKEVDQMWAMYKARRSKKGERFTEPSKGRDQRTQLGAGELADESSDEDEDEPSDPADDEFKSDSDELEWDTDQGEDEDEPVGKKSKSAKNKDANPLLVELEKKKGKSAAKAADMWFSNDLFASKKKTSSSNANDAAADSSDSEEEEAPKPAKRGKKSSKKDEDSDDEDDFDDLRAKAKRAKDAKAEADAKAKKATKKAKATGGKGGAKYDDTYDDDESDDDKPSSRRGNKKKGDDDFEVVAAERDASSGSDSDESDGYGYDSEVDELSDDTRARILALGKKMIRKKDREELIEDGYNRYAFDDDDLPDWFAEDERRFMKPVPQYTTEELAAAKAELAAVNTRPIKKVAEAKWRKKKRAEAKMAAARSRAAAIIEQDDVPDVSKAKEIERVFAKARRTAKGNPKKTKAPVVARKFHRGNAGGPSVDKRQLADLRGQKNAAKRAKQRGGGKSGGRGGGGKRKSGGKR